MGGGREEGDLHCLLVDARRLGSSLFSFLLDGSRALLPPLHASCVFQLYAYSVVASIPGDVHSAETLSAHDFAGTVRTQGVIAERSILQYCFSSCCYTVEFHRVWWYVLWHDWPATRVGMA